MPRKRYRTDLEQVVKSADYDIDLLRDIMFYNLAKIKYYEDYVKIVRKKIEEGHNLSEVDPSKNPEWFVALTGGLVVLDYQGLLESKHFLTEAGYKNVEEPYSLFDTKNIYANLKESLEGDLATIFHGSILYSNEESIVGVEGAMYRKYKNMTKGNTLSIREIYDIMTKGFDERKPGKKSISALAAALFGKGIIYSYKVGQTVTTNSKIGDIVEFGPTGGTRKMGFYIDCPEAANEKEKPKLIDGGKAMADFYFDDSGFYCVLTTRTLEKNKPVKTDNYLVKKSLMERLAKNEIKREKKISWVKRMQDLFLAE